MKLVVELLQSAADRTQVIVATHSPHIVAGLCPDQVIVTEKEKGETRLRRLSAAELSQWLNEFNLAELWRATSAGGLSFRAQSMSRIVILCEGDTKDLAIRYFVAKQWREDGLSAVGLHRITLDGKLQTVGLRAARYLDEQDVLGVFTLIDLQGMDRVQHLQSDGLDARVERVRDWLRRQVSHKRQGNFFPHLGVHETEAWILADGEALARRLGDSSMRADPYAEQKDFEKPPARRISELFVRNNRNRYNKTIDGRPLFAALRFEAVYEHCRYFKSF